MTSFTVALATARSSPATVTTRSWAARATTTSTAGPATARCRPERAIPRSPAAAATTSLTGSGLNSWLMFYGSTNMTLTNTTFSTSGGGLAPSVSQITGFQHAVLAAGTGDFTLDASAFTWAASCFRGARATTR